MLKSSIITIDEFIKTLNALPTNFYCKPCNYLSNASIGKHTRHVIELYQSLINGYDSGEVCYDKRERNERIEQEKDFAITQLNEIKDLIDKPNKPLILTHYFQEKNVRIESNFNREVLYNLEHLVHHQALIRVVIEKETNLSLSESFGVGFSTVQHKKQCLN